MAYGVFAFKAVKPQAIKVAQVRGSILAALNAEKVYALSLLNQTIATWNEPPTMKAEISYRGGDVAMVAGPSGDLFLAKKWMWLDQGTRVRFAQLSKDWVSKTSPGSLRSGAGAGMVLARGHKAGAHRGIEARHWSELINKMIKKGFQRRIQEAVTRGMLLSRGG